MSGVDFRALILSQGVLERGDVVYASGAEGNNHMDAQKLREDDEVRLQIVQGLADLAIEFEPDYLVGVPSGGNAWAKDVAQQLSIPVCYLKKDASEPGVKKYEFSAPSMRAIAIQHKRAVIVEDVGNRWTSINGVLRVPFIDESVRGIVGIWFRGSDEDWQREPRPSRWLVHEHIPAQLTDDSPLWSHAE